MTLLHAFGFELTVPVLALGVITGLVYGLLGVGIVLVYRTSRVINFAHGEIGAFGATVLGVAVLRWRVPYWAAFPVAVAVSAGAACVVEAGVVRRLRHAPKLMGMVATLGFAQVLRLFAGVVASGVVVTFNYPQPPWLPTFDLGPLLIHRAQVGMALLTPPVVVGLAIFLRYSRAGLAMRAAAANAAAARLCGVPASRVSTLAWAIAGALSGFTAILVFPGLGLGAELLGPNQLLRALVAAVVAGMSSLPVALAAGVAVGVVEESISWNYPRSGLVELALFAVVVVALLVRAGRTRRGQTAVAEGSWLAVRAWPPLDARLRSVWAIRNLRYLVAAVGLAGAVVVPAALPNRTAITLASIAALALVGLSIFVVTGLAGELSLGQFALAGIGATASYHLASGTGNYLVGFAGAAVAGALASVAIGLPALRIRGLMSAVATLSFAVAAQGWLFQQPWMLGDGVRPGRPILRSLALDTGRRYYYFALALVVVALWVVANVRGSGLGRSLVALRDNEQSARALSVPATRRRLEAFLLAGALAGVGGALYGHSLSSVSAATFDVARNFDLVGMTALGGMALVAGPLIGAAYIVGVPSFIPLDAAGLAAGAAGWLVLLLYYPGGVGALARPARDWVVAHLARRAGLQPSEDEPAEGGPAPSDVPRTLPSRPATGPDPDAPRPAVLEAFDLEKHFGGLAAVDGVDLAVRQGETVGIIGPNGAGKTTLFNLLSGFTRPDAGRVLLGGVDVSRWPPERRARHGLARSFQGGSLFETMTVSDTVRVALERAEPARLLAATVGLRAAERRKDARAEELVALMGLGPWTNAAVGELSTGTRRITELACMLAMAPTVLLLDEPSAGVAQAEVEALAGLLEEVKAHLGTTLVVIEHDMALIAVLSGRLVAMDAGRVIGEGVPAEVLADPRVVESYLGTAPDTAQAHRGTV